MISRIRGRLSDLGDVHALVENNGVSYEVLLPSGLAERLKRDGRGGDEIVFETIHYIEAGDRKSAHYPRLVGFDNVVDREFFSLLLRVPGMGIKKALKSLTIPIRDIAVAIETRDTAALNRLPGVGARLADKIIAELHGKTAKFALSRDEEPLTIAERPASPFAEEAVEVLAQLQYRPVEARQMVDAALTENPKARSVEALLDMIFKSRRLAEEVE
jgi:Holliday junction DNA helicase RuvA